LGSGPIKGLRRRSGRHELAQGVTTTRIRQTGAGRLGIEDTQPGITEALDLLVETLTRGDPMSPLRWACKSAKLGGALTAQGWPVSRQWSENCWTASGIVCTRCRRRVKARRTRAKHEVRFRNFGEVGLMRGIPGSEPSLDRLDPCVQASVGKIEQKRMTHEWTMQLAAVSIAPRHAKSKSRFVL
jgi:hypothetical protein